MNRTTTTFRTARNLAVAGVIAAAGAAAVAATIPSADANFRDVGENARAQKLIVGADNDNPSNPGIQPPGVAANQSLKNGDQLFGGRANDTIIGRLGPDFLVGRRGDDILVGGTERGSDTAAFPNNDVGYGGRGNDIFLWAPGDGSDAFIGGEEPRFVTEKRTRIVRRGGKRVKTTKNVRVRSPQDRDILAFGTMPLVSGDNSQPETRKTRIGFLPTMNVSGKNLPPTVGSNPALAPIRGFCEVERAPQGLGYDHLVKFFVQANGNQAVTLRTKNVETVLCRTRDRDTITEFFLGNRGKGNPRVVTNDYTPKAGTREAAIFS